MMKPIFSNSTHEFTFVRTLSARAAGALALSMAALLAAAPASAQSSAPAVTATQRATAQQVAAAGVPLSALKPDAPAEYTVKRGDTLWRISGLFLSSPWRWPELWGMNLQDIHNPHLIYPGQALYLDRVGDRAILRTRRLIDGQVGATVKVSPRNRIETLDASPLPTLEPGVIEPFLTESLIVDDGAFDHAPRIVAVQSADRLIAGTGDRAYALGPSDAPIQLAPGQPTDYQVFRETTLLKDPITGEDLGHEAQYVGRVTLVRGQTDTAASDIDVQEDGQSAPTTMPAGGNLPLAQQAQPSAAPRGLPVPAVFRIDSSKQEMRVGDRLIPTPPRAWRNYAPHAPTLPVNARVVKVFGDESVRYAGQNQIVVINKGTRDGIETGQVLMVVTAGRQLRNAASGGTVRLPDERNGLAMVFRPFERASYALIMNITDPVQAGDRLVNPK